MASDDPVTVVAKDRHSVNIYSATTGNFIRNVYITSGEIIGQPICSQELCTITCMEGGRTLIIIYELPRFRMKNRFNP